MKKEKKQIDYIFICQKSGRVSRIVPILEKIGRISELRLLVTERKIGKRSVGDTGAIAEHLRNKLKKIVKRYQVEHCVVGADVVMAEKLQMAEVLFMARKRELLERGREIMMEPETEMTAIPGKKSFLLVLDSEKWFQQDVLKLLLTAKDYYNDLNIVMKDNHINLSELTTFLYDEWGIVLHVLPENMAMKSRMDFTLFLLGEWENSAHRYSVKRGYVVCENEKGLVRTRGQGKLSAGFVYECDGFELPYQMAVNIFYQNPKLYDKFAITFIDIYSV